MTAPAQLDRPEVGEEVTPDLPWVTIVWNDPVNLMSYVTFVIMEIFSYPREKAERMMLDVHEKGRAVVSSGTREQMENDVARLHARGLWATVQQD
ncbi:MAG: ATP-dependent Clp protease adapter ClpS [Mycobacteriales bacterium]